MFEGMDIGTLFKMKDAKNNAVYRVIIQSFGSDNGLSITLEDEAGESIERTVVWVRENMDPVI
ncbi:hypothetical protein RMI40_31500 [Pseudomonas protegens]|uniref:hypothetical protein n=1 Tax=Pseudomonas protegens TaxID=380021 RepID=UPI00287E4040|nr:hypothetical protein [Pseudomonas protegens]MDS9879364.1 hypothetical protein [Pseudomonas protegens]